MTNPMLSGSVSRSAQTGRRCVRPSLEALETRCLMAADPVLTWNTVALDAIKFDSFQGANAAVGDPDHSSRMLAIVQTAVYDAVNSIDGSYAPYLVQLKAPRHASITAAVAQAAHDTLESLIPAYKTVLDAKLAESLSGIPAESRDGGVMVGSLSATAILAARSHDGSDAPMNYTPVNTVGHWQPDPLHPNQKAVGPLWGDVTPFGLESGDQFRAPAPPALGSRAYATAYDEVKTLGAVDSTVRTPEQTIIGIFWGYDGARGLGTPPRLYNQIVQTVAIQQGNGVIENARLFALVNTAMADAGISAWETKYHYDLWRPVTAIRAGQVDGNSRTVGDPTWTPLGAPASNGSGTNFTPPFPAYTSGHATFGGATFRTLANFYGRDKIRFSFTSDEFNGVTTDQNGQVRPVVTRTFTSFSQAAEENGQSRIYLGIHWSFDKVEGIRQGNRIADFVYRNLLTPVNGDDSCDDHGNESRPLETFQAVTTRSGDIVLATVDGKPVARGLSTQSLGTKITTNAANVHDTQDLIKALMSALDAAPWGATSRKGRTLKVDMRRSSGDMFWVF